MSNCVFCMILYGLAPAKTVFDGIGTLGIVPLNPVVPGHVILMPRKHVRDAAEDSSVTRQVVGDASEYVRASVLAREFTSANIITSIGAAATQTIFHLHVHVVPRREGDGLALPWSAS